MSACPNCKKIAPVTFSKGVYRCRGCNFAWRKRDGKVEAVERE